MAKESSLRSMKWNRAHQSQVNARIAEIKKKNPEKYKLINANWCKENKEHLKEYRKAYRKENLEKVRGWANKSAAKNKVKRGVYSKEYQAELRKEIIGHYSGGTNVCSCCGEFHTEFLTIDHVNGDGAKQRKSGLRGFAFYLWLKRNNFPEGFRILCMNCNFSFGMKGYCPHQLEERMEA